MASSNRHWPSLFKSKPCNTHHHQWQHDVSPNSSLVSNGCLKASPFNPSGGGGGRDEEGRSPEPKPRWNPKPEQIRILEAIFNSGMVNPPRDEIRKIRAQLQEYGNVGDANVFYWFQNRKSRSKNKNRHLLHRQSPPSSAPSPTSSSSSDKSSSNNKPTLSNITDLSTNGNIVIGSGNYGYATGSDFFSTDNNNNNGQFMFQSGGGGGQSYSEGSFSELSNVVVSNAPSTNMLLTELMKDHHHQAAKMKMETQLMMSTYNTTVSTTSPNHTHSIVPASTTTATAALHVPPSINLSQGAEEQNEMDSRPMILVFINDVAFQVCAGPFNFREAFGDDVVLFTSSGQPVLTNEWGDSLSPLQHGASYYLYYTF